MANVGYATMQVIPSLSGVTGGLTRQLNTMMGNAGRTAGGFFGTSFTSLAGRVIGAWAVGNVINKAFDFLKDSIIGVNSEIENSTAALTQMLGSGAKAKDLVQDFQDLASASATLDIKSAATFGRRLVAMGIDGSKATSVLKSLANAAAGTGTGIDGLSRIVRAYGQISAKGRVQTEELLQLQELGIPAIRLLAEGFGVTTAQMQEMVTKGLVPANKALPILQKQLDKFYGDSDRVDTFSEAWEKLSTDIQSAIGKATLPLFQRLSTVMQSLANGNLGERLANSVSKGIAVATPIVRDLAAAGKDLAEVFGPVIGATLEAGLAGLVGTLKAFAAVLKPIAGFLANHKTAVQTLTIAVIAATAAWKAYRLVLATVAGIQAATAIATTAGQMIYLARSIRTARDAMAAFQLISSLPALAGFGWVGIAVVAVAALAAGIYFLATRTQFFQKVWAGLKVAGLAVAHFFAGPFLKPFQAIGAFFAGPFLVPFHAIRDLFTVQIPAWGAAIGAFFQALPGRILSFLANLPSMLGTLFLNAMKAAAYALGFGVGLVVGAIIHLPGWIATLFTNMWNTAVRLTTAGVQAVVRFFVNLATNTLRLAQEAVTGTINFFARLPGRLASFAQSAARAVISALQSAARGMISAAQNAVNSTVSFFQQLPGRAGSALRALPGVVRSAVAGAGTWLLNAGRQVIQGLINGIQSGIGRVTSLMRNLAGKVRSGFADALKIFSPSKVFRQYGQFVGQGFVQGVKDSELGVVRAITNMAGAASLAGANSAPNVGRGSLIGTLNLNGSGNTRNDLAEVQFQLRRIQRGGLYA